MKCLNQMEPSIQTTYSNLVRSLVTDVEQFLVEIDQNDIVIRDESMVASFRNMSRTLQRLFSKWEKRKPLLMSEENNTSNSSNQPDLNNFKSCSESLFDSSFLYDIEKPKDVLSSLSPDSEKQDTIITEREKMKMRLHKKEIDHAFAERMKKKFKKQIEDSHEELIDSGLLKDSILNPPTALHVNKYAEEEHLTDPAVEKINDNTFNCKICGIELNKNNVKSHLKGKSHHKNKENNRSDRKSSSVGIPNNNDTNLVLKNLQTELTENKQGSPYIVTRNSTNEHYYCNLCKIEIPKFSINLLQHLTGQQHKRLC